MVRKNQQGFTLVELMVVVAIIGILAAVALPNFRKYQAKSKTAEAKIQLASAYSAMESFFSEYNEYDTCLTFMGFNPAKDYAARYYAIGFEDVIAHSTNIINNAAGCTGTDGVPGTAGSDIRAADAAEITATGDKTLNYYYPAGKEIGTSGPAELQADIDATAVATASTYILSAQGIISDDANFNTSGSTEDWWTIDENKNVRQNRAGY